VTALVSSSGYYEWRGRAPRTTEQEQIDAGQLKVVRAIDDEVDRTYASPRMTAELHRRGYHLNHKRVERLMRQEA
jgi:HTH-like domain